MSASLLVDLGSTCQMLPSLTSTALVSGWAAYGSGSYVGQIVDMLNADTFTNVFAAGQSVTSGPLKLGIQTSDDTVSGNFTDPTSGLQVMPTVFSSGGILLIGQSGIAPGIFGVGEGVSGQFLLSGFFAAGAFLRPHRYARLFIQSGSLYDGALQAGFIGNYRTVGSGGGFSYSPASGAVNV